MPVVEDLVVPTAISELLLPYLGWKADPDCESLCWNWHVS